MLKISPLSGSILGCAENPFEINPKSLNPSYDIDFYYI
jgi:hypothetical protein